MLYTIAQLGAEKLADVQSLEKSLGKTLIALAPKDVHIAPLKEDELTRIKQVEAKWNISLVAVQ
jgi:hypothetical protein